MDETICPFCGAKNRCLAHSDEPCWCVDVKVPRELLEAVPKEQKRKVCICRACVQAYSDDPKGFLKKSRKGG